MESSCPSGEHMSWEVLNDVISFIHHNEINILILSGGEVTTDPEFYEKISYISRKCNKSLMTIQSNGSWIANLDTTKKVKKLLDECSNILMMQVSTHKKYYPNYDFIMSRQSDIESVHEKIKFVADWQGSLTKIQRLGRAVNLTDEDFNSVPSCSTLLCRSHQIEAMLGKIPKLSEFLICMEFNGYLCKPLINEYGNVYAGETQHCVKMGNITGYSTMTHDARENVCESIMNKLINTPMCNKCGQVENLKSRVPDQRMIETGMFRI